MPHTKSTDVKKRFLRFFIFQTFLFKKRWQSSERKHINKKHFRNNSNEIDL